MLFNTFLRYFVGVAAIKKSPPLILKTKPSLNAESLITLISWLGENDYVCRI